MKETDNEIKLTKGSVIIILIALNLYPIYLSIVALWRVDKFQKIFTEMLEGESFFGVCPL